jgi:hypothetical protein
MAFPQSLRRQFLIDDVCECLFLPPHEFQSLKLQRLRIYADRPDRRCGWLSRDSLDHASCSVYESRMNEWNSTEAHGDGTTPSPQIAVARAVQRLAASAVRRAAVPLIALLGAGIAAWIKDGRSASATLLISGSLASSFVMLAYAVQAVRRVLGRSPGAWAPLFWVASWIPYVFGVYVLFGMGLRPFTSSGFEASGMSLLAGVAYSVLGGLLIRAQWKLSDVHSLSLEMTGFSAGATTSIEGTGA